MWGLLKREGILHGQLIKHVWSRFQPDERLRLLEIMEEFDLICEAPKSAISHLKVPSLAEEREETQGRDAPLSHKLYFVPSLFKPGRVKEDPDLLETSSLTFFVDFSGLFTSR